MQVEAPAAGRHGDGAQEHEDPLSLPPHGTELFIGGVPRGATEDELRQFAEQAGEVRGRPGAVFGSWVGVVWCWWPRRQLQRWRLGGLPCYGSCGAGALGHLAGWLAADNSPQLAAALLWGLPAYAVLLS